MSDFVSMKNPDVVLQRVRTVGASVFGCRGDQIARGTTAADIDGWDSLSHTVFIVELEREFGIHFVLSRIVRLGNVGDLVDEITRLLP